MSAFQRSVLGYQNHNYSTDNNIIFVDDENQYDVYKNTENYRYNKSSVTMTIQLLESEK